MSKVLLLREPSGSSDPTHGTHEDKYESEFTTAGYYPISITPLETVHTNLDTLQSIIRKGPGQQEAGSVNIITLPFSGVIITSKRSCDAMREALESIRQDNSKIESWSSVPFYVVGEATATALKAVFDEFVDLGIGPLDVRGQSSGNAAKLADFILTDVGSPTRTPEEGRRTLLYLTGDKNRDTITHALSDGPIHLQALQVYKTEGSPDFEESLVAALSTEPSPKHAPWWIVFFAPSSAEFVAPILTKHFALRTAANIQITTLRRQTARVATIGPTTKSHIRETLHLAVDVMAPSPTPEDIVACIREYDKTHFAI